MSRMDLEPRDFLSDLRARWHSIPVACAVAVSLALVISLAMPKRYTATAELLIQPPGGNDPRAATAISPVYLESLKSYERLALSDTLFLRAIEHVGAAGSDNQHSIESLKRSILRVVKPPNTAVLEISATMSDPRKAQALAQFVAEQTVLLSRSMESQTAGEATSEVQKQFDAARTRLSRAHQAQNDFRREPAVEGLETELNNNADLLLSIDKQISQIRTEVAGYKAEQTAPAGNDANSARTLAADDARLKSLLAQRAELTGSMSQQQKQLHEAKTRTTQIDSELESAELAFETAESQLNEALSTSQFRGERLHLIDPGVVPQEPRSPNVPLNAMAALVLALVGSVVFIGITPHARKVPTLEVPTPADTLITYRP